MADVLELSSARVAGRRWSIGVPAFKRLDTGLLINAQHRLVAVGQVEGL